jgi:hypothetical protein
VVPHDFFFREYDYFINLYKRLFFRGYIKEIVGAVRKFKLIIVCEMVVVIGEAIIFLK